MIQQLSLHGTIADEEHDLFVSTLTILAGTQPVVFSVLNTIWKPDAALDVQRVNMRNELTEPTRVRLTTGLPLDWFKTSTSPKNLDHRFMKTLHNAELPLELGRVASLICEPISDDAVGSNTQPWVMSIADIPAAGTNRKVSMQTISETNILSIQGQNASITEAMRNLGYLLDFHYITTGVRFHFKNGLIMEFQKVWDISSDLKCNQVTTGGYLIKAYVNVGRSTDLDRLNQMESLLLGLQKDLHGYIDLSVPDRKSMDSRMVFEDHV